MTYGRVSIISVIIVGVACLLAVGNHAMAQTTLKVPYSTAVFAWNVPPPDAQHSAADKHVIVCGALSVDVPMPATSKPVKEVIPGVGTYQCELYAANSFGRQAEPNIPFPPFEAGLAPLVPTNPRLEVRP